MSNKRKRKRCNYINLPKSLTKTTNICNENAGQNHNEGQQAGSVGKDACH